MASKSVAKSLRYLYQCEAICQTGKVGQWGPYKPGKRCGDAATEEVALVGGKKHRACWTHARKAQSFKVAFVEVKS